MRFRRAIFLPLLAAPLACAGAGATGAATPGAATTSAIHPEVASVRLDPTVRGAHLVPIVVPGDRSYGVEPGGGVRSIAAGVRVVSLPGGAVVAADDRLPGSESIAIVTALPERIGGGFLFAVARSALWRADKWLAPARPIYSSAEPIDAVVAGLDRVYVRTAAGAWRAIDGVTGERMALGPWPASPSIAPGAYAAADGWRALAIADLRGPVATFDAGATWRPLRVPIDARTVVVNGDAMELREREPSGAAFEVRPDGQVLRMPDAGRGTGKLVEVASANEPSGPLGPHPLLAAVEDGWPLDDHTALVARDGALARVRLADGAIADLAVGAYPLRPSRCHPIPMGTSVGFVCGEPRGATILYAFDPARGRMDEVRRFEAPRAVVASGNGALAVRGACDARGAIDDPSAHHYCVRTREGAWREIRVEGGVGGERVVVLADGRFAIVSPPQGDLAAARITLLDGNLARSVPITFPAVGSDVLRVLDVGVWLDGIEERRPGVLGAWIEAAGTMLGVEIALDGTVKVGPYVRDAGSPMVSGRYGLGWTASRQAFETTDGGMTWTPLDVPQPIGPRLTSRACGPIGCSAAGWLRIGWGKPKETPLVAPPAHLPPPRSYVSLPLECEAAEAPRAGGPPAFNAFYKLAPPATSGEERLLAYDSSDTLERSTRFGSVARVFAWGPKTGEWEHAAKWTVRWAWAYGGASDARSTIASPAPPLLVDMAKLGTSAAMMLPFVWTIATGDDPSHALLIAHRSLRPETTVFELEADRAPIEVRRADGEGLGEIDAAIRAGGRWYVATPPAQGERAEAIVWQLDGPVARELGRVPRATATARPYARLAWRTDGKAIGLVVDGQPSLDRAGPTRWVAAIDLESGTLGEVEPLGASDLGDRGSLPACTGDDVGWRLDVPAPLPISLSSAATPLGSLHGALARVVIGPSRVCVERIAGSLDGALDERALPRAGPARAPSISISVVSGRDRRALRCRVR